MMCFDQFGVRFCSWRAFASLSVFFLVAACLQVEGGNSAHRDAAEYDVILSGGKIVDGSRSSAFVSDVGVRDGKIAYIGDLENAHAKNRYDVSGKIVAPGFIDLHSHADDHEGDQDGLRAPDFRRRQAANITTQGVTTVAVNPDGYGKPGVSLKEQREALERGGAAVNIVLMVPHNGVRATVMSDDYRRPARPDEIAAMRKLVADGMKAGAFGLTSGFEYPPAIWSETDELVALMEEVAQYDGVHISHIRSETTAPMWWVPSQHRADPLQLLDGVSEIIEIAERTNTKGVISHMKVHGLTHWGQSNDVIKLIEEARARGVKMFGYQYPYNTSGSDGRIVFIPDWVFGVEQSLYTSYEGIDFKQGLRDVLTDEAKRADLQRDIAHAVAFRGGAENIVIFDHPDGSLIGKNLQELADEWGLAVFNVIVKLQLEGFDDRPGGARIRSFSLNDSDITNLMRQPWVATASGGGVALPEDGPAVHARYYGTFPRKIGHYARDRDVMSLEDAVWSATGLPKLILGLKTRGLIKNGFTADIVVFDYDNIIDKSTFSEPHQRSAGIEYLFVNGAPVIVDSQVTDELPGQVLTFQKD